MKAMAVERPAPIESRPLREIELPVPEPDHGEILVRIRTCGVCRTDLHVAEGDLPPKSERVIPGHEIAGVVERCGPGTSRYQRGARVGVAWLRHTCGQCVYCRRGRENLCLSANFTGWDHDGGYTEYCVVSEEFAYALPEAVDDLHVAPLLCAGIIGFRAIRRADIKPGMTVGLYGFGGSAHLAIQVLRHWKCRVFVMSRGGVHRDLASELGAEWIGAADEAPPAKLDAAILFAPAGNLVAPAMEALDRGGILSIAGIYLSPTPPLDYERQLFYEREIRSVTANTREDAETFLKIAGEIPIRTETIAYDLADANEALRALKHDEVRGAAVLRISGR